MNQGGTEVGSDAEGFVQNVEEGKLLEIARMHDAVVRLEVFPGDFITREDILARFWCRGDDADSLGRELRRTIAIGKQRSYEDDMGLGMQQLSLIAVRSLSPALNAIGAAMDALDRLMASFVRLGSREIPSPYRRDHDGRLRVVTRPWDLSALVDGALDPIRHAATSNPSVVMDVMRRLAGSAPRIRNPELRRIVLRHLDEFADSSAQFPQQADRIRVRQLYARLRQHRPAA